MYEDHLQKPALSRKPRPFQFQCTTLFATTAAATTAAVQTTPATIVIVTQGYVLLLRHPALSLFSFKTVLTLFLSKDKKRKSLPMKREQPSIKENLGTSAPPLLVVPAAKRPRSRAVRAVFSPPTPSPSPSKKREPKKETRNKSIYDFFTPAPSHKITAQPRGDDPAAPSTPKASPPEQEPEENHLEYWKERCQTLEQTCQDKEEQLKAVSNNRTIVHHAMQTALASREEDIQTLRQKSSQAQRDAQAVLEELVRSDAAREARGLRERIAADGARLGRMVHTRAGLRSVESWEDGHASKQLQASKNALVAKYKSLEKRREAAEKSAKRIQEGKENGSSSSDPEPEEIGGIVVRTKFDAMEAVESVRFHLANLRQEEKELALDEKRLNGEKAAHIRALKRVASEDYSRFRSRPKVRRSRFVRRLVEKREMHVTQPLLSAVE
jgi:hypothetical protein